MDENGINLFVVYFFIGFYEATQNAQQFTFFISFDRNKKGSAFRGFFFFAFVGRRSDRKESKKVNNTLCFDVNRKEYRSVYAKKKTLAINGCQRV